MNDELTRTLQSIADLLGKENDLLRRTDYVGVADLLPEKQALFARLASQAEASTHAAPTATSVAPPSVAATSVARRLVDLVRDNQTLLARAINVQTRIIGIVLHAINATGSLGYARDGKRNPPERVSGLAISSRI